MTKSTLLHLRIPFSIFLAPVFFFALSQVPSADPLEAILLFVALHVFLYPASNGYNSFYDRDEGAIGGLASPPKIEPDLLIWAWVFDAIAVGLSFRWGWGAVLFTIGFGVASKLYSHPRTRWKASPALSFFVVTVMQGAGVFLFVTKSLEPSAPWSRLWQGALLSTLFLAAGYPITQIYQHDEDGKRGDLTLSRLLGIRGTFLFSGLLFLIFNVLFFAFEKPESRIPTLMVMQLAFLPATLSFTRWAFRAWQDTRHVTHRQTMRMNVLFTLGSIAFFVYLGFVRAA